MEDTSKPDPRWNEFIEQYDEEGKAIGFKLPDNDFLFRYDVDGGWKDEKGNYYTADGILEVDSEGSADELDEEEISEEELDEFEELLRQEEEGIVRRPKKEEPKK